MSALTKETVVASCFEKMNGEDVGDTLVFLCIQLKNPCRQNKPHGKVLRCGVENGIGSVGVMVKDRCEEDF